MSKGLITFLLNAAAGVCLFFICAYIGYHAAELKYEKQIAEMEKAQAEAIQKAQTNHADNLAKATDTILLAQSEYNDLRAERDRLLARLRHADGSRGAKEDSADALRARVAKLEELVGRMAETASRCGDGFERCAQKHDALADVVKP